MPTHLTQEQQARLRAILTERFNLGEMQALCLDLGIDDENLGGDNKVPKVVSLVRYFANRDDFAPLLGWLKENRPDIADDFSSKQRGGPHFPICNIPPRNEYFTGRADLLTQLSDTLASGGATAITQPQAVHGLGGVGKSGLASEFFYRHAADYDVAWWLRAEDTAVLAGDLARLAGELSLPEAEAREQAEAVAAVMRWLDGHPRWLLVFDNATQPAALAPFLPAHPHGHILITSRYAVWDELAADVPVDALPPDDAVAFLLKRTRQKDRDAASALAKELGSLPLALEQAAGYMRAEGVPLAEYLDTFRTERQALLAEGKPLRYPDTVATTWLISFGQAGQTPGAADLLNLLAFLAPDDIPLGLLRDAREELPDALAEVVGSKLKLQKAVGALHKVSLLKRADDMVSVHRLVQAVARDRLTPAERRVWAEAAAEVVSQAFPDVKYETWPQCEVLLPHALAAAEHAEALGIVPKAASYLLNQVGLYLEDRAEYARAADLLRRAVTLAEEAYGPEHPDVAIDINNLGNVLRAQGDLAGARALFERALRIGEKALDPNHPEVAVWAANLGSVLYAQGDLEDARQAYQRVLAIHERVLGLDHPYVAIGANNLGRVLQDQGDLAGAQALFERALRIWEANLGPDHPQVAIGANNLGTVLRDQGNLAGACALFERALRIDEKVYGPGHPAVAIDLNNLGDLLRDQGDLAGARALLERALRIDEKALGPDHPTVAIRLNNLGGVLQAQGDLAGAQALFERALRISEQALGPDHPTVAIRLNNLGSVLQDQGDLAGARTLFERALRIFEARLGPEHPNTQIVRRLLTRLAIWQAFWKQMKTR